MKNKIKKILRDPLCILDYLLFRFPRLFPDKVYLSLAYKRRIGETINWDNPKTFNEKLQWLKLHDRNPLYTIMVDKVKVKDYVSDIIGIEHIIPTIGVWSEPDDIVFETLPCQFVLKCNHNSGLGMYICSDKTKITPEKWQQIKSDLRRGLKENYFIRNREWPYKNVQRCILAEKFMVDESGTELKDYKIFCFNGEPAIIEVDYDRFTNHQRNVYSIDWEKLDLEIEFKSNPDKIIPKPACLEKMLECARKISLNIPHVRTDFYIINNKVYFGEMTFFHGSGYEDFRPKNWNEKLGDLICLNK